MSDFSLNLGALGKPSNKNADIKPKEKFWGNVGVYAKAHDENGDLVEQFISLNYGIPMSSVEEMKLSGQPNWRKIVQAKNSLLAQLLDIARSLEPGEVKDIPMVFQIRHVKDESAAKPEDDAFVFDLGI